MRAFLALGAAAHAYDLDDYTLIANDHPSAVLVPALISAASAQSNDYSGMDLLDAYLVGLEVIFCLGEAVNMDHYKLGWHTTSTLDRNLGRNSGNKLNRIRGTLPFYIINLVC